MEKYRLPSLEQYKTEELPDGTIRLSFERPRTQSGKMWERCPNKVCRPGAFLIGEREKQLEGTLVTTCPYCGYKDLHTAFISPEDTEYAKETALNLVMQDIKELFSHLEDQYVPVAIREYEPKPYLISGDLLRNATCHICSREYGVFALALYCPDCGAPNVSNHFNREIAIIDRQIELSRKAAEEGDQELGYRLLANAHEDVVTALETTLKSIFIHLAARKSDLAPDLDKLGNAFQNLEKAQKKYAKLDIDLLATLPEDTRSTIEQQIQKRHVIGHNLGLADERYLNVDNTAEVGQSVILLASDIQTFAQASAQLIQSIEKELHHVA